MIADFCFLQSILPRWSDFFVVAVLVAVAAVVIIKMI